jgi:uncharacterized RDD family membrane protein YckC
LPERPPDPESGPELTVTPETGLITPVADVAAWRDELSARVNRYRARRKARPPRYPSLSLPLSLPFEPSALPASSNGPSGPAPTAVFDSISHHALALDAMRREPVAVAEMQSPEVSAGETTATSAHNSSGHSAKKPAGNGGAKIIEFPGFSWGPPAPPPDQLAEPVIERPRILEAPELVPPPPALGGITIEAAERKDAEKRPGIDIPLQSAPLGLRVAAGVVDGLIVAVASALFGFIFWKVAAVRPPLAQMLGLAAGIPVLFWFAYQYLLIVYAACTPGSRAAGLELARFDGTSTTRSLRRWRVLASCLSAVSAGMGYAWVLLDEDALCWHDRITHTYLAPKKREAGEASQSGAGNGR